MFSSYVTNPNLNKFNYTSSFMYEAEFLIKFIILSLLTLFIIIFLLVSTQSQLFQILLFL